MPIIIIPLVVIILNDFIKCIIKFFISGKFDIKWMFRSGGMPSGHSALTGSVIALTFLEKGSYSIEFMIATIFGILFMYDAKGIRAEAGKHAKVLNNLQKDSILNEYLGHSSLEVVVGAVFGFISSYFFWKTGLFEVIN